MELVLTLKWNSTSNVPEGILLKFLSFPGQTLNEFLNFNRRKRGLYSIYIYFLNFLKEFPQGIIS